MRKLRLQLWAVLAASLLWACGPTDGSQTGSQETEETSGKPANSDVEDGKGSKDPDKADKDGKGEGKSSKSKNVRLVSWNLFNFGKSKTDADITYIADKLKDFDLVAVQEVSTGPAGAQAVARLADELNRKGAKWDYTVSDPTEGPGTERYAFMWQTARISTKTPPWLEKSLEADIDREPYIGRFYTKDGEKILLASLHAIPTAKKPETECELLYKLDEKYPKDNLIIVGDFNLSEKHEAFNSLKERGITPAFTDQKTSLKMKEKDGEKLGEEYDNLFIEQPAFKVKKAGAILFNDDFPSLKEARDISDHLPVWAELAF